MAESLIGAAGKVRERGVAGSRVARATGSGAAPEQGRKRLAAAKTAAKTTDISNSG